MVYNLVMKQIFGFGSLINSSSLLTTVSNAADIRPCYVKGFRRQFNLFDVISGNHTDPRLAGMSYCALDISAISDTEAKVNGVLFAVDDDGLLSLIKRERGYELVDTVAYDFETGEKIGDCQLFSACKNDGVYDAVSPAQVRYLEICLEGTKQYGENFYRMFLDTTYVGDKLLSEVLPELTNA